MRTLGEPLSWRVYTNVLVKRRLLLRLKVVLRPMSTMSTRRKTPARLSRSPKKMRDQSRPAAKHVFAA
jgi:hypothetical protein